MSRSPRHGYEIADEATPGRFSGFAVHPQWPLLASMLCGAWLAWPWFVFNGVALGTPTRRREALTVGGGLLLTAGLAWLLLFLIEREVLDSELSIRLAVLVFFAVKLGVSYAAVLLQMRTFATYDYYGGEVRSGVPVVVAGIALRPLVIGLSDSILWKLVVSGGWILFQ
jgi:hypothetical protein